MTRTFQQFNESEERHQLAKDIGEFLSKHGKRSAEEPEEWSSPDAGELEGAAHALKHGHPVSHPRSNWESGGYHSYSDKTARAKHDALIARIKKHVG